MISRLFAGHWRDIAVIVILFTAASVATSTGTRAINLDAARQSGVWFQADISRVYDNMTDRWSNHYRTKVHPLFSISTHPPVFVLNRAGVQKTDAVRLLMSTVAGLWLVVLYLVLRTIGLALPDAVLFSGLGAVSASAVFWSTVPETFLFGSLSILIVLLFAAVAETRRLHPLAFSVASAISLSMTVTNWMVGILTTAAHHRLRKSVRITVDAFTITTVVWAIQNAIYRSSQFFLWSKEELGYVMVEETGNILNKSAVFLSHALIMPTIGVISAPDATGLDRLSVQLSSIGSSGLSAAAASLVWLGLLAGGAVAGWQDQRFRRFKFVLAASILGQFVLHNAYGDETFLYSLHWLPMLVIVAALSTQSSRRWLALVAVVILIGLAGANNLTQFGTATTILDGG